ncbi:MAG: hypothetical protein H0V66_14190 [Bdellovibrionales bacterium]|nr:hypothetical protein [Bdellovibrionales bacterium]
MPILMLLLLLSPLGFTREQDCRKNDSWAEKNECMAFERDQAVGRLMTKVTEDCAEESKVEDSEGEREYQMVLDECMVKKLDDLSKRIDK